VTSAAASPAATDDATIDTTLAALADPIRRRSVELLAERPRRAGELAVAVGVSPPVMSRHLRVLRDAALVDEEHPPFDARVRIYSLRAAHMAELRSWLAEAEAGWSEQLTALKEHLERR
jgi:DNA-binding transcriptional ArsR family regulator